VPVIHGSGGRRIGGKPFDQGEQPPRRQSAAVEVEKVDAVVPEQVGLYRGAMLVELPAEAD
jgi:hypothetical protein